MDMKKLPNVVRDAAGAAFSCIPPAEYGLYVHCTCAEFLISAGA